MLRLEVPIKPEEWDEENQCFIEPVFQVLTMEHSLISISKWESKWHKPFLFTKDKTDEEVMDYIHDMTITQNVDPDVYNRLTSNNIQQINAYIENPMTATTFSKEQSSRGNNEIITAELIYYWMIALNIPFECQKWHLNRLLTLIRVCNVKNQPPKKMGKSELMRRNSRLNAERKARLNSKG